MTTLKRELGLIDAAAIYVGIIIGSGIFFAPAGVAAASDSVFSAVLLWCLGGLIAGCGALCYAECGARLPRDGGFYVYYREVYGEGLAFVGGWTAFLITYPASIAVIALILASYMSQVVPALAGYESYTALVAVAGACALNVIGVRENAWSQRVLSSIKVGSIALLCGAALFADGGSGNATSESASAAADLAASSPPISFGVYLMALVGVLWTYSGWSDVTLVAGELKDPARNLGRTVFIGTTALVALYALVQIAVTTLLPHEVAASSTRVLADAVGAGFGQDMGKLVALLVVISTFGAINGTTLVVSRLGWAMANDGVVPRAVGHLNARFGTPARSIGAVFVVATLYIATSNFQNLLGMFTFSVWIFYSLTTVALLVLRKRKVGEPLQWRAPGGILPPAVVIGTGIFITVSLLLDEQQRTLALWGLGLLSSGGVAYVLWKRLRPATA